MVAAQGINAQEEKIGWTLATSFGRHEPTYSLIANEVANDNGLEVQEVARGVRMGAQKLARSIARQAAQTLYDAI
jgi:hypothetical protein